MTPRQERWKESDAGRRYRENRLRILKETMVRLDTEIPSECPDCGCTSIVHYGRTAKGTERYRCKECRRTFTPMRLMSRSQVPEEKWMAFAECYVDGISVRSAAIKCGISNATAHRMKCRLEEVEAILADGPVTAPDADCEILEVSLRADCMMSCVRGCNKRGAPAGVPLGTRRTSCCIP